MHTFAVFALVAALAPARSSLSPGANFVTYTSSVDATNLDAIAWMPPNGSPGGPARPLCVFLHAADQSAAQMINVPAFTAQLDARGWVGLSIEGRPLSVPFCDWNYLQTYIDSQLAGDLPGESDVLDAIEWISNATSIDPARIYLVGHSMGGGGVGAIGLKTPDRFAGVAMLSAVSDLHDFYARSITVPCLVHVTGGPPGTDPVVDTRYKISSPRFLLENAYNLPVFYGHGLFDQLTYNLANTPEFQHGWHLATDATWSGCHDGGLCFGHTPTHDELNTLHPDGYAWAYQFTDVHHTLDPRWLTGTPDTPTIVGTPDPLNASNLLGMFDFFASKSLVTTPDTVVYKTYEDEHESAYWVAIESTRPWDDAPAAIRARRVLAQNKLELELSRVAKATIDLDATQLTIGGRGALRVHVERWAEPAFDPALDDSAESLTTLFVLDGPVPSPPDLRVKRDGVLLPTALVQVTATQVRIGPLALTATTDLEIFAKRPRPPHAQ